MAVPKQMQARVGKSGAVRDLREAKSPEVAIKVGGVRKFIVSRKRASSNLQPLSEAHSNAGRSYNAKVTTGTGKEVMRVLGRDPGARVIAVTIDHKNEEQRAAAEGVFAKVAQFLPQLIATRQEESLQKFVDAIMPSVAPSPVAIAQAEMFVAARSSILQGGDFILPKEVSRLAGYSETNPSVYPNKWKRSGKIFAIQNDNKDYFPFYALNPRNKYQPREQVGEVLRIFGNSKDAWGMALWFASLNSFLDDERPQDILATDPDRVVAAAEDEMAEIEHG